MILKMSSEQSVTTVIFCEILEKQEFRLAKYFFRNVSVKALKVR